MKEAPASSSAKENLVKGRIREVQEMHLSGDNHISYLVEDEIGIFWWKKWRSRATLPTRKLAVAWIELRELKLTETQFYLLLALYDRPQEATGKVIKNLKKKGLVLRYNGPYFGDHRKWTITDRTKELIEAHNRAIRL